MNAVDNCFRNAEADQTYTDLRTPLWSAIDREINLNACDIYRLVIDAFFPYPICRTFLILVWSFALFFMPDSDFLQRISHSSLIHSEYSIRKNLKCLQTGQGPPIHFLSLSFPIHFDSHFFSFLEIGACFNSISFQILIHSHSFCFCFFQDYIFVLLCPQHSNHASYQLLFSRKLPLLFIFLSRFTLICTSGLFPVRIYVIFLIFFGLSVVFVIWTFTLFTLSFSFFPFIDKTFFFIIHANIFRFRIQNYYPGVSSAVHTLSLNPNFNLQMKIDVFVRFFVNLNQLVSFLIVSYNPDCDPFDDDGLLWFFNYFFYNKKLKRIVLFKCRAFTYVTVTQILRINLSETN